MAQVGELQKLQTNETFFRSDESDPIMNTPLQSQPGFSDLFTPKLVTVLREGYRVEHFRADLIAGLTVAIVALPLSMAIAIASGAGPERGLYTAIIGGFLVSLLGGSRFQIGGPAGAFIVLVAATVARHGIEGMLLATFLSGFILLAIGYLKLGTYIKLIPFPVTVGFTAGIAVIIFASQIKDLLGLRFMGPEPGELIEKLPALWQALPSFTPQAVVVSLATISLIILLRQFAPRIPAMLVAVIGVSLVTFLLGLPVETIGTKFGGIPDRLPVPALPDLNLTLVAAVLPDALAFALLGAIESLLSAVVADGMSGRRHRSNCEIVAQGYANIGSALFGGLPVTGTIARTATNVRSGAHGPVSGMLHSAFLLGFMLVAAPLASFIPLAALAGVLATVAWNMAEKREFWSLVLASRADALIVLSTFFLTIFRDLTTGIVVGFAIGAVVFINRMSAAISVETHAALTAPDVADSAGGRPKGFTEALAHDDRIAAYRINGAFFFGAASSVSSVLEQIADRHKAFIVDLSGVPFLDSTGANALKALANRAAKHGVFLVLAGANSGVSREISAHHVADKAQLATDMKSAISMARNAIE
jgi:sulfate permease, SulP family